MVAMCWSLALPLPSSNTISSPDILPPTDLNKGELSETKTSRLTEDFCVIYKLAPQISNKVT